VEKETSDEDAMTEVAPVKRAGTTISPIATQAVLVRSASLLSTCISIKVTNTITSQKCKRSYDLQLSISSLPHTHHQV